MKNLKKTELVELQTLNSDFVNLKTQLGDLELQKHLIIEQVQEVRKKFSDLEVKLQTGEIKEKEKE